MSSLGFDRKRDDAARERMRAERRIRERTVNDALLDNENFREFLCDVANSCRLLDADGDMTPWWAGHNAALRNLVMGVVRNSAKGPKWLQGYAQAKAEEQEKRISSIMEDAKKDN